MPLHFKSYRSIIQRVAEFLLGLIATFVYNSGIFFVFVLGFATSSPSFNSAVLVLIGLANIFVFLYFLFRAHWFAIGMFSAIALNTLSWLAIGARDLQTLILPFWINGFMKD
jgi:hypothetical protein